MNYMNIETMSNFLVNMFDAPVPTKKMKGEPEGYRTKGKKYIKRQTD